MTQPFVKAGKPQLVASLLMWLTSAAIFGDILLIPAEPAVVRMLGGEVEHSKPRTCKVKVDHSEDYKGFFEVRRLNRGFCASILSGKLYILRKSALLKRWKTLEPKTGRNHDIWFLDHYIVPDIFSAFVFLIYPLLPMKTEAKKNDAKAVRFLLTTLVVMVGLPYYWFILLSNG